MDQSTVREEIWKTIEDMNRLWTAEGKPEELADYFHQNMVAIAPTTRDRMFGREACVAGWKGFVDSATIHSWRTLDPDIRVYGDDTFAIVTYDYEISFAMGGHTMNMQGRDMFSLVNEGGKWWVVSDQFSSRPA